MNLWMVIYIAGRVVLVWPDPLPDYMGMADCQESAAENQRLPENAGQRFVCEWHITKPAVGSRYKFERLE